MITIDGSQGEGGGQIVRSALSLSLVTGQPVTIHNIRARRSRPGLRRQHAVAVEAAARLSRARVEGDHVGSGCLIFAPQQLQAGTFDFQIGTAGSTSLVLQTLLPALLLADGPSTVVIQGGTHNPLAPPFEFLQQAFVPLLRRMGMDITLRLERYGFYPVGGGRLVAEVEPAEKLRGLSLRERGRLLNRDVRVLLSRLPDHIAQREIDRFRARSTWHDATYSTDQVASSGPGNVMLVELAFEQVTEVFAGFGQKGIRAETVAERLWDQVREYAASPVPVGPHLADQLLLPLALAAARHAAASQFLTLPLTEHTRTQSELLPRFLPVTIADRPLDDGQHELRVAPR